MKEKKLTTTSYAILSWLAVRPWTTYELAKQMRRNLRFFWPRAESQIYQEPKVLVARGLARAETGFQGRRRRTTYSITSAGRRALKGWLAEPGRAPLLEFDALVRIFFSGLSTPEAMTGSLEVARSLADEIQHRGTEVALEYLEKRAPFPQRIHLSALTFDFLWGFAEHLRQWASRAQAEVGHWKEVSPDPAKIRRARRLLRDALREKGVPI